MDTKKTVDQKDLLLLYHLRHDGRKSFSELAKYLGMTSVAVKYRVDNLIKHGIIKKFTIDIDQSKLTPNYQSYLLQMSLQAPDLEDCVTTLNSTRLCESIVRVAASHNLVVQTIPISNIDLKELIRVIERSNVQDYTIAPVLNRFPIIENKELVSESISLFYCPECQESMSGEGFVDKVGKEVMGFCCKDCRDRFVGRYREMLE